MGSRECRQKNLWVIYIIFLTIVVLSLPSLHRMYDDRKHGDLYKYVETNPLNYWVNERNYSTAIIADAEKIEKINAEINSRMIEIYKSIPRELATYNLLDYETSIAREIIVDMIKIIADKFFQSIPNDNYYNFDSLLERNEISYAVVTEKSNIRIIPTDLRIFCDQSMDRVQGTSVKFGDPLVVLHKTMDGVWSFVRTYNNVMGWIRTKNIALTSRDEFANHINMNDFLVVISKNELINGSYLDMGVRLKLEDENREFYTIKFPMRDKNGLLYFRNIKLEKGPGLHRSYLAYSEKNIVEQAMKYYGTPYEWGSADNGIDCSGLVLNVYSVFGLRLPRNSSKQRTMGDSKLFSSSHGASNMYYYFFGNMQTMRVSRVLNGTRTGSILYFPGHVMLYLGRVANRHYVLHAVYRYSKNYGYMKYEQCYPRQVEVSFLENLRKSSSGRVSFMNSLVSVTSITTTE